MVMRSELQMVILTSGRARRRPCSSILNSLIYRKTRLAEKGVQFSRNTSAKL